MNINTDVNPKNFVVFWGYTLSGGSFLHRTNEIIGITKKTTRGQYVYKYKNILFSLFIKIPRSIPVIDIIINKRLFCAVLKHALICKAFFYQFACGVEDSVVIFL